MGVPGPSASDLRAGTYQGGPNSSILDGHMLTILIHIKGAGHGEGLRSRVHACRLRR
jgi:hypothetical protein